MSKNKEIFWNNIDAIKKKFENDWYNWEKVQKQLDKVKQTELVDNNLSKLEWNIDKHYSFLKKFVKEDAKNIVEKTKEKVEEKAESIAKKTLAKMEEEVTKKSDDLLVLFFDEFEVFY